MGNRLFRIVLVLCFFAGTARAQEAKPEIPATPSVTPAPAPTASPAPVETPLLKKLGVGTSGYFQPGILLQGWYQLHRTDRTSSTFRVRRAEIQARGELLPHLLSYVVVIDPARALETKEKTIPVANQDPPPSDPSQPETITIEQPVTATSLMKDVYLTYIMAYGDISLGQFKIPVSWEGCNSSSRLLFPERALISREYGDRRDIGLRAAKTFHHFGYSAGLFNGAGANNLDAETGKDGFFRLEAYPVEGLMVAGVVYGSLWNRNAGAKDRYEADLRYERGPLLFQGEFIRGRDAVPTKSAVTTQGFYAVLGYRPIEALQPVVRIGRARVDLSKNLDFTVDPGPDVVWQYEAGLNYYIRKNEAKLQLAYSRFHFAKQPDDNQVTLAAQVAF